MFLDFHCEQRQEYVIIRDYYVVQNDIEGVLFIVRNTESGEILSKFVKNDFLNNKYTWEKTKKGDVKFQAVGIEHGKVSALIEETGFLKTAGSFNKNKITTYPARKMRYILQANEKAVQD